MDERCGTCRFWSEEFVTVKGQPLDPPLSRNSGECRRYPPQWGQYHDPDFRSPLSQQFRPSMMRNDWCGEYQPDSAPEK